MYHPPRTSIFDRTDPGVSPARLEAELREALQEPEVTQPEDAFEITDPCATVPVPAETAELPVPAPTPMAAVTLQLSASMVPTADEAPFDEGTAAEWNPRWQSASFSPQPLPLAEPPVTPTVEPQPIRRRPWQLLAFGASAAVLALAVWAGTSLGAAPAAPTPATVPEGLKPYVTRAQAGDVAAMRALGLRYVYGIEAPMDRNEGLRWLVRAAQAGSPAAAQELRALGIGFEAR